MTDEMAGMHAVVNGVRMEYGCYADGGFSWVHVREVLADLVDDVRPDLADELRVNMSDDASEEYDALDALNAVTVGGCWYFDMDLFLGSNEGDE